MNTNIEKENNIEEKKNNITEKEHHFIQKIVVIPEICSHCLKKFVQKIFTALEINQFLFINTSIYDFQSKV